MSHVAALVMAGGRSERMRASGGQSHKALRRLDNRTLLQWNIDGLRHYGFHDIYVTVSILETELLETIRANAALSLITEDVPLGTIGGAQKLPEEIDDVVVVNVDNVTDLDLRAFACFHKERGAAMTIACHNEPFRIPFGRLQVRDGLIESYDEKPSISVRVSSGTYVLNRRAINRLAKDTRTDIPQLVRDLLRCGETVCAYAHEAKWIDVNDEKALIRASELVDSADSPWPGRSDSLQRKLRVMALVSDLGLGGGENRILNIARHIDARRFEYEVYTLYGPDEANMQAFGDLIPEFRRAHIAVTSLNLLRPRPHFANRTLQRCVTAAKLGCSIVRLWLRFMRSPPDLIDAHLSATLLTVVPAALMARIPVCITLYQGQTPSLAWHAIRRATAVFTDSAARAEEIALLSGRDRADIQVTPNTVSLPAPTVPPMAVRAQLGVPESARTIVCQIAGMVPTKGYETLLRAAARFLNKFPETFLLGIGYDREATGYRAQLERLATDLGITKQVRLAEWPGNIADVWSIVDIHVHASHRDSLPNAIIEGMSLGKPIVATRVGGIGELVSSEETGLLVPPNDPESLAVAVERLILDISLRERFGKAGRDRFLQRCAPDVSVRALESRFEAVAATNTTRAKFQVKTAL